MSRFADPSVTERFVLGDCECDGKPHDEDYLDLRTQLSGVELVEMESTDDGVSRMERLIVGWNLTEGGEAAPVDRDHIARLSLPTLNRIGEWWSERAAGFALPNGSGAPSRNGSRASASHTRTTPKRR